MEILSARKIPEEQEQQQEEEEEYNRFIWVTDEQTNIDPSKDKIKEFLDMDNEYASWEELMIHKISKKQDDAMEEDITMSELDDSLFNHLNDISSPGIDGFKFHT